MADHQLQIRTLMRQVFYSGTVAAIAMIPVGVFFTLYGLRINEYGMKVIQTFFGSLPIFVRFALFVGEHFLISWSVATPLLLFLRWFRRQINGLLIGLLYGGLFYLLINALALPMIFGDPTPFALGFNVIYPSLIVHLVYGAAVWYTSRKFSAQKDSNGTLNQENRSSPV